MSYAPAMVPIWYSVSPSSGWSCSSCWNTASASVKACSARLDRSSLALIQVSHACPTPISAEPYSAQVLELSPATVQRDWTLVRARLRNALDGEAPG